MQFEVRPAGNVWEWVLLNEVREVLAASHRTFPTSTQASAAALAWSQMVNKAARTLTRQTPASLL
ncbi:hypothetical protein MET9862_03730 [Methylobacterium symbioticum]|jgi:hypothetical protein|uniref:Uncharacterized protein n=1 Tax=Methylobacterium symbioticum TaxID=2584084 RepID=A0A509EFE6_9HYPH|nr:hypothetical protein MET9862_03730 [Methylobacterium symbioticum]